jgi:hypothetical protein
LDADARRADRLSARHTIRASERKKKARPRGRPLPRAARQMDSLISISLSSRRRSTRIPRPRTHCIPPDYARRLTETRCPANGRFRNPHSTNGTLNSPPVPLLGRHVLRSIAATNLAEFHNRNRAPEFGQRQTALQLYNVCAACRYRTIIGKNSRDLPEFFPN